MLNCHHFSYVASDTSSTHMFAIIDEPLLSKVMEDCRQKRIHCDVSIIIKNQKIHGHKLILGAAIPYFETMFNSGMKEGNQEVITIKEENIDPDVFERLVKFVYSGTLEIDESSLQNLLICAEFLHFNEVVEACREYFNKCQAKHIAGWKDIEDPIKPNIGHRGVVTIQPFHQHLRVDTDCCWSLREKSMVVMNNQMGLGELLINHRQKRSQCDISIIIQDQEIYCHKLILEATIPYFEAMFNSGLREENQSVITIKGNDIDPDAFRKLIDFVYTGQLKIDEHHVRNLLICANFFQLDEAVQALCHYINFCYQRNIHFGINDSICSILLNYLQTDDDAQAILLRHFQQLTMMDEFARLTFQELVAFISSDKLKVTSESEVFEAVMKWIRFDLDNRKDLLPKLLCHVKWHFIAMEYVIEIVERDELIRGDEACRIMVDNVKKYHLTHEESLMKGFQQNQRKNPFPVYSDKVPDFIEI